MIKIYIDPGHGGTDPGAIGNGFQEKDLVLVISIKICNLLSDYNGVSVRMSRTTDKTVSHAQRTNDANTWSADYFLSIHINAGGGAGYEDYIYIELSDNSKTAQIRDTMHSEIIKQIDMPDRGMKKANFHVLRETNMSAMLSENGFIDNVEDAVKMKTSKWLEDIALGHVNGLVRIFSLTRKQENFNRIEESATETKNEIPKEVIDQISIIQRILNDRYNFKIVVDNIFGIEMNKAFIKAYQIELNKQFNEELVVDGIWGLKTKNATRIVKKGDKGNLTWILQAILYCKGYDSKGIDGIFGGNTEKTVKSFQNANKLVEDGIVGKQTWSELLK